MSDVLARILDYKRDEVAAGQRARPLPGLLADARAADPPRGFRAALQAAHAAGRHALIAEIKRASPSKGLIRADFQPAALARAYEIGGAACLSVLTDAPSFMGDPAHLGEARAAASLPVLRKDFMVDPWQIAETRAMGADACLLILAALDDALAGELMAAARDFGLDILVECHDAREIERAGALGADLVGINNRSLRTFETRLETTEALAPLAPAGALVVAESGIADARDLARLSAAGARAFLVGESLMRAADVAAATRALLACDGNEA